MKLEFELCKEVGIITYCYKYKSKECKKSCYYYKIKNAGEQTTDFYNNTMKYSGGLQ